MGGRLIAVGGLGVTLWPLHPAAAAMTGTKQNSGAAHLGECSFRIRLLLPLGSCWCCY
jgi:hypothetical protein